MDTSSILSHIQVQSFFSQQNIYHGVYALK